MDPGRFEKAMMPYAPDSRMQVEPLADARILIVDDGPENILLLRTILSRSGCGAMETTLDPREAVDLYERFRPDLVLLDVHMPFLDGFAVLQLLGERIPAADYVPILVLTADVSSDVKNRALAAGARDFLTKPFDPSEVLLRIRNLLETRRLYQELQRQNEVLEERVRERTRHLEEAQAEVLRAEHEKKRFYRDVVSAVTSERLQLVDPWEIPAEGAGAVEIALDEPAGYAAVRQRLRELGERLGMDQERLGDLLLAVGEAATNAIKHAARGRCRISTTEDRLVVRVSDTGAGIHSEHLPASILMPGYSTKVSLGMGYTLMLRTVDRLWLATGPEGTTIQLEKRLRPPDEPELPMLAGERDW